MTVYCKGQPGELPEILDFINMVFSMHRAPHNFRTLLPKLYGADRQTEWCHYLAKEDGKISAVVCVLPITLEHGGHTITCATVGSVSVHPYSRGKGYMKQLMAMAAEDMERQGITLSILDGRRHRYQYYGYEPGGHYLEYRFNEDNFRHCAARYPDTPLTLRPVAAGDTERIGELSRMYSELPVHTVRSVQDFFDICISWGSDLYAVELEKTVNPADSPVLQKIPETTSTSDPQKSAQPTAPAAGYICGTKDHVYELVLSDETLLFPTLKAWSALHGCESFTLAVPSYDRERIRGVSGFYERFSVREEDNYRIFNYSDAIRFFLSIKSETEPLTDGRLALKIGGRPTLAIAVSSGVITIEPCCDTPNLCLSDVEAVDLLFSPASFYGRDPSSPLFSVNWFPLPLSVSHLDKC